MRREAERGGGVTREAEAGECAAWAQVFREAEVLEFHPEVLGMEQGLQLAFGFGIGAGEEVFAALVCEETGEEVVLIGEAEEREAVGGGAFGESWSNRRAR